MRDGAAVSGSRRSFFRDLAAAVASANEATEPLRDRPSRRRRPVAPLTDAEIERYSRQLVLPEWGEAAQLALAEASVLVIGAGALGGPVALYLAGAGVGRLGIVDDDAVELSNLHRQPLHFTPDLGVPKAESAAAKLRFLNPDVIVEPYQVRVDAENAADARRGARPRRRLLGRVRHPLRGQRRLLRRRRAARRGRRARPGRAWS